MRHLVLIQYKISKSNTNEIFYAISSFKKYAKFDYEFCVIGDSISFFPEIPVIFGDKSTYEKCRAQHIRVANDLYNACKIFKNKYSEFCLISDDFFYINDFTWEDLSIPKHNETFLDERKRVYIDPTFWRSAKQKTAKYYIKNGILNAKDFTTHAPAVYNIEKLMFIIEKYNLTTPPNDYTIEDLYGNMFYKNSTDIKLYRCRICNKEKIPELIEAKKNGLLFANVVESDWWNDFEKILKTVI